MTVDPRTNDSGCPTWTRGPFVNVPHYRPSEIFHIRAVLMAASYGRINRYSRILFHYAHAYAYVHACTVAHQVFFATRCLALKIGWRTWGAHYVARDRKYGNLSIARSTRNVYEKCMLNILALHQIKGSLFNGAICWREVATRMKRYKCAMTNARSPKRSCNSTDTFSNSPHFRLISIFNYV